VMDDSVGLSSGIALRDLWNHPDLRRMTIDSISLRSTSTAVSPFTQQRFSPL
jgi:hypothetical protein